MFLAMPRKEVIGCYSSRIRFLGRTMMHSKELVTLEVTLRGYYGTQSPVERSLLPQVMA